MTSAIVDNSTDEPTPGIPLTEPAGGVPAVIDTAEALTEVIERFANATGPVAADAERASGFRYGQATYLAQFKREGAGIALIDTAALPDLSALGDALGDAEFVFHAASQDLPGMHELGIHPHSIFDTEVAARLLGWPKVGLAAVVERTTGFSLAKEHSAQDWSQRPLPQSWLAYAALDVELLLEVREVLGVELDNAGKSAWAFEEFEAIRNAGPSEPRVEPWRRVSGINFIRDARGLAVVRALWEERDIEARRRDMTPGRVLRDAALVSAAKAKPASIDALVTAQEWQSRGTKRSAPRWWPVIEAALALPESQLPAKRPPAGDGPPAPRAWAEKRPDAAARLQCARDELAALSAEHQIPVENLLQPDAMRRACWEYQGGGNEWIESFLAGRGARSWQIAMTAPVLHRAFITASLTPQVDVSREEAQVDTPSTSD